MSPSKSSHSVAKSPLSILYKSSGPKKNLREIDFTENYNDNFDDTLEPASYWPAKARFDYLYLPKELAVCCQQGVDGQ